MALAVCLLFDGPADRALRGLWDRIEEQGVPTLRSHTHGMHHPHLSLAVLLDWDVDKVRAAVEALPDRGPFEIHFEAVGVFPRGRVSLIPAGPDDLVARQQAVVEAVRGTGALMHKHYEIGRWLPHCSLAPRASLRELPAVAALAYEIFPLTARITRAALINSSTGEQWALATLP
ncbi:2'-5' RNA ligase family protein [Amycolatopsis alkalitolerans]|uniref:2'-5' RNA ligase family protein n=1 Tax=Amycolatopsis alkalitolerans TaxID=2547244 RepID=A0A5C4M2G5_9PSEU|nr:2'-5' RNA ligase family protein [Amycolatopsis alkalitolerans]TNC26418.1 2'-5' RNA ligase family protein [Amycolatopsis alkalitolerans]